LFNKQSARVLAHKAICLIALEKKSLSESLFSNAEADLAFAKSLVFGSIRFYHHLNDIITPRIKKPLDKENLDLHCLLVLGAYQIIYTDISRHAAINETVEVAKIIGKPWAKGFINAILRGIDRDQKVILESTHYSHPSWFLKKLKKDYPDNYQNILIENNKKAPMSIRIHPSIDRKKFQKKLEEKNILSTISDIAPQALILSEAVNVYKLPDFEKGSCYVQDISAQLSAQLISPQKGDYILDACCAPGGKTTHIAELCSEANVIALDNDEDRITKVHENINRLNVENVKVILGDASKSDWWDKKLFDKILIDAPCSSTGVIRRHPDIKLLRKGKDINQITKIQARILDNLWALLKPGGIMVYATCSILKDENENQIINFLKRFNNAKNQEIQISWGEGTIGKQQLPEHNYDGFYYAKISKKTK
jgi:16S rRNA (cytosine967-C5)-methyltransferase